MLFNTPQYLLFLPFVVLVYYCIPKGIRYIWLLVVSYYFYMQWNALYVTLLFSCTLLTYLGGRMIQWLKDKGLDSRKIGRKICFVSCIMLNLAVLGFFKYADFGISLLNRLMSYLHAGRIDWNCDILLPVGISFYILQALGYLIDVYRGDIYAEKSILKYALFISFFPQLVAGPIERSRNLLVQLHKPQPFCYENLRKGSLLVLYGLFLKMVIADRAAMFVDTVYENSETYPGFYIVIATVFFAIQIYCDFYGYSTIARGSALIMGIRLMDNFKAPYYARSVKEFWRRWHISLSGWFRDYLYIPLGGNRKGLMRREGNLIAVFAVSGLWHGASLAFVFWGLLNGWYQVMGDAVAKGKEYVMQYRNKWEWVREGNVNDADCRFSTKLLQTIATFALVTFAWLFFRAGGLKQSMEMIGSMISCNNWTIFFDGSLFELGVARNYMTVLIMAIVVLFRVDYHKYHGRDVADMLLSQGWYFRVSVYMMMIFSILLYGCYGELYDTQQFIYFQF